MPPVSRFILCAAAAASAATLCLPASASCGAAFCSVNTDLAAEAAGIAEGSTFDLRYERIDLVQPRSGTSKIAFGSIPRHHDEISTRSHNYIASYTHTFASGWGVTVAAPYVDRKHAHIHNHRGAKILDAWDFREFGDLRVTGRYQLQLAGSDDAPRRAGAILGLKLPTGRTSVANAAGDVAEPMLQPGSGTTDVVLGGFFHQQLAKDAGSWFAQAQVQRALNEHDGFRPGTQVTVDLGYSKAFHAQLSGIVQLNAVAKGRDAGANAEPGDSGSRSLFLSPGLSWQVTDPVRVYAFYQHPLSQDVNGVQLTPRRSFVLGVSARF